MPIHDYECRRCARRFELLVMPNQAPQCPSCNGKDLQRLFSGTASVSTTRSRQRSAAVARSKATALKKEQDQAHSEYVRKHIEDHS